MKDLSRIYLLPLLLLLLNLSVVAAQEDDSEYLLSESTYRKLNEIQERMEKGNYNQAEQELQSLLGEVQENDYEKAVVYQTLGYVYSGTDQYAAAAKAFINATDDQALPSNVTHNLHYNIAQLKIQAGDYQTGLDYLDKWFASEPDAPAEVHLLAATAHYQLRQFKSLIPHIRTAIDKAEKTEQSWYDLLLAAYLETNDLNNAALTLKDMLQRFPENRDYWLQLVSVYQRLDKTSQSLAVMELALKQQLLDEAGIIQLAQMYLQAELPYKSATLLQEKINSGTVEKNPDNLELLTNGWLLAQETERAAATLHELAKRTGATENYYRLGQIYFELERWQDSIDALNRVVTDQDFTKRADASLLLGIAAYHLEDYARSDKALHQALGFDSTRQQAEWWLDKLQTRDESGKT